MEIITGVERRRHWRTEDKLRIVAEAECPDPPAPRLEPPAGPSAAAGDAGRIEIMLPDGTVVRVGEDIGAAALRRVLAALRR